MAAWVRGAGCKVVLWLHPSCHERRPRALHPAQGSPWTVGCPGYDPRFLGGSHFTQFTVHPRFTAWVRAIGHTTMRAAFSRAGFVGTGRIVAFLGCCWFQ